MTMDRREVEVMAPAGNFACLQAALQGGADAVYFGVGHLNMRSHAANNFSREDLPEVVRICHAGGARAYLTLNIILYDEELPLVREVLLEARAAGVDAVIASDMAAIMACRDLGVEVHLSTQLNISNTEALRHYAAYAEVAVLARELNLAQVRRIFLAGVTAPSGRPVRLEMFVHGALCMAVSGKCYLSLHTCGTSANRGGCYQLCRRGYRATDRETGEEMDINSPYIMSPKDLCTIEFLDKIVDAGVRVLKIEGRARNPEYVKRTTRCYRAAADAVCDGTFTPEMGAALKQELADVFNRGFWDGWYQGAAIAQWSEVYGSQAARHKVYCGKVTNWYDRLGVAEITVESATLHTGDDILIIGETTGVVEDSVREIRVDLKPCEQAPRGTVCSIPVRSEKIRRGDRLYIWSGENLPQDG